MNRGGKEFRQFLRVLLGGEVQVNDFQYITIDVVPGVIPQETQMAVPISLLDDLAGPDNSPWHASGPAWNGKSNTQE